MPRILRKEQFVLYVLLISITFLGDILRRFAFYFDLSFTRYTTLSKIAFILLSLLWLIFSFRDGFAKNKTKLYTGASIIALILIFVVGRLFIDDENIGSLLTNNLEHLGKYLFLPYLIVLFIDLRTSKEFTRKLLSVFEIIFFINIGAIVLGAIFDIEIFYTYDSGNRFGFKGIYSMSGQTSLFFILMIFYYLHNLIFRKFSYWFFLKLVLVILVSILVGTKRIFFFLPLLLIYYLFFLNGYRKKQTYLFGLPVFVASILLFATIEKGFHKTMGLFYEIYETQGLLSSFTSFRSNLLSQIYYETIETEWTFWNFLFGGLDFSELRSEMGFIDLFLFFGLFGFSIYMWYYKMLLDFKFSHSFYWFFVIFLFLVVFLADAFIFEANTPILFLLLCFYFYNYEKEIEHRSAIRDEL